MLSYNGRLKSSWLIFTDRLSYESHVLHWNIECSQFQLYADFYKMISYWRSIQIYYWVFVEASTLALNISAWLWTYIVLCRHKWSMSPMERKLYYKLHGLWNFLLLLGRVYNTKNEHIFYFIVYLSQQRILAPDTVGHIFDFCQVIVSHMRKNFWFK